MQDQLVIVSFIILFLFSLCGGWASRMCGGAKPNFPSVLNEMFYALPHTILFSCFCGWWSILVGINVAVWKRTGHGRGMSLKEPMKKGSKPEKIEVLTLWLQPYLPTYWYKFLIMSLLGFGLSLIPGIIWAVHVSVFWGTVYAGSGLLAGPAYALGWRIYPNKKSNNPYTQLGSGTEVGEFVTGISDYFWLLLIFLFAIGAFEYFFD
jgi:hypothetical protein